MQLVNSYIYLFFLNALIEIRPSFLDTLRWLNKFFFQCTYNQIQAVLFTVQNVIQYILIVFIEANLVKR